MTGIPGFWRRLRNALALKSGLEMGAPYRPPEPEQVTE